MKPSQVNVYLLSNGTPEYIILKRKMYRLEECDDEMMAESYNDGDRLPIMGQLTDAHDHELTEDSL